MDLRIEGLEPSSLFQVEGNAAKLKSQKNMDFDKSDLNGTKTVQYTDELLLNNNFQGVLVDKKESPAEASRLGINESEAKDAKLFGSSDDAKIEELKSPIGDLDLKFELKETKNDEGVSTKKLVVSVVDKDTGEVIRQVPPEEIEALFSGQSKGSIVDKKG